MQQSFRQAVLGIAQNRVKMLSLSGELLPFMRQCNARLFSVSCFEGFCKTVILRKIIFGQCSIYRFVHFEF